MAGEPALVGALVLKCRGGPIDGERRVVPAGTTEITVPLPNSPPSSVPVVAVYRVQRRRRGRGVGYMVLVYVRNQQLRESTG